MYAAAKARIQWITNAARKAWLEWARESFAHGASLAHRFSRARAAQEILRVGSDTQPHAPVAAELEPWKKVWLTHGCSAQSLPGEAQSWP
eukprot:9472263-Pyramimonas_sp.AAC.2